MIRGLAGTALFAVCTTLAAGPPYLTDDPEPVDLHHWELYLFTTGQSVNGVRSGEDPALEANYGPFADAQILVQVPVAFSDGDGGSRFRGMGDLGAGFKYRFLHETDTCPQLAVYPQIQAPTGNAEEGLGSGHWRILLPLWIQKGFGSWTTYGGAGWCRNPGGLNRNFTQWGWLLQRELGEGYSLGAEVFHQGSTAEQEPATTAWNLGFECGLMEHLQLVGSAGRIFQGARGSQFYAGLRGKF